MKLEHYAPTVVGEIIQQIPVLHSTYADHCQRAAMYVDQVLKGAKPADLPVQLPTTLQLVVNLRAAKAIGHTIP